MREKVLKNEISVVETTSEMNLPPSVQKIAEEEKKIERKIREMRQKDKEASLRRLDMLRNQIGKKKDI